MPYHLPTSPPLDLTAILTPGPGELPSGHDRVSGLTWRPVASCEACEAVLAEGATARDTAAEALNTASSRSHAVLSVRVTMTLGDGRRTVSMLHMVDLAGGWLGGGS